MSTSTLGRTLGLTALAFAPATAAMAQNTTHVHIGHAADVWVDTPNGWGLLPTALAEAEIAIQHAELATRAGGSLAVVRRHVEHVLHAVDPGAALEGPGLGYGVRRATEGVLQHIELAEADEAASDNVRTHARHIAGAARSVTARADRIVSLARQLRAATSISGVAPAVEELHALARGLVFGTDIDGDRRVGWAEPEGGLRQAQQHMTLLKRGEGLVP